RGAEGESTQYCTLPMSGVGLGCVKTPTLAARVETSRRNCIPENQIILHTRGVMPSWRIVFSTFRDCMSFHTARVRLGHSAVSFNVRFARRRTWLKTVPQPHALAPHAPRPPPATLVAL